MINSSNFRFFLQTELICGVGVYKDLPDLLKTICNRPLFLIDENVAHIEPIGFLKSELVKQGLDSEEILLRGTEEPDYDYLDEISDQARSLSCDFILAIGGGSALDLAKAVAVLVTNTGSGLEYRGFDQVKKQGIPYGYSNHCGNW